ncbi:MAG: redoxin domain-containing protein [candidate division KSB1 bacterium]|nr:redoxin domain-containing protein [candidate division KSB1 bacterium]MDZ7358225.1 redoxin domain-containing protein [candidate division KSB1 bacterium]MDZ7401858.1 redoxin domain-containing protein [candidate division KSB1 bacterium]
MKKRFAFWISIAAIVSIGFFCSTLESQTIKPLLKPGDPIPAIEIKANLTNAERQYLGVKNSKKFRLSEIQASVILVEFFNKYCPHCQRQAPILNELYNDIQQDAELKSKVKMLGIGSGNNARQIELFRQEKNIPFPLIPDEEFVLHDEVGRPKTPFTILIKKTDHANGVVSSVSLGVVTNKDQLLAEIRTLVVSNVLVLHKPEEQTGAPQRKGDAAQLSDEEFQKIVSDRLAASGEKVIQFQRILTVDPIFDIVYKIQVQRSTGLATVTYFVRKVYRNTVCGNCHDAHFWYCFDTKGKIINFYSIYLTKAYNKLWSESELLAFTKRFIGRSIQDKFIFNPTTDAVTGATITASLIYDTLGETKNLFAQLKKMGAI